MPTGYSAILIGASVMTLGVTSPNPPEPPPADGDVPTLSPGAGWTGLTPDPDPIGDSEALGYDATAIGRWDCAQNDTWTGDKYVGIALGAHIGGIDRVDFSVNNGTWGTTSVRTLNPDTGGAETDYTDAANGDFRLITGAPGRSAGLNGSDIGAMDHIDPAGKLLIHPGMTGNING